MLCIRCCARRYSSTITECFQISKRPTRISGNHPPMMFAQQLKHMRSCLADQSRSTNRAFLSPFAGIFSELIKSSTQFCTLESLRWEMVTDRIVLVMFDGYVLCVPQAPQNHSCGPGIPFPRLNFYIHVVCVCVSVCATTQCEIEHRP